MEGDGRFYCFFCLFFSNLVMYIVFITVFSMPTIGVRVGV